MKVSRLTPLTNIPAIHKPQWNGGKRCLGIRPDRVGNVNRIECDYVRKSDGERIYPQPFFMRGHKILSYPIFTLPGGTKLHMVPIEDLEILEVI